jgi:spore germination cell wall hydrolase CwlJ-like protein
VSEKRDFAELRQLRIAASSRFGIGQHATWLWLLVVAVYLSAVQTARAGEAIDGEGQPIVTAAAHNHLPIEAVAANSVTGLSADEPVAPEVRCLALNIYFEARSEPELGQRAVAHVVMNRVAHPGYPDTVCEVIQQGGEERLHRCQFSWWCDGQSDRPVNRKAWEQALRLAHEVFFGISEDSTDGALWYHATYVKPYWSEILLRGDKIGRHIFYLENERSTEAL